MPSSAQAQATCPGIWAGLPCDAGGTDICTMVTSSIWECDLTRNGGPNAVEGTAVYGYAANYDYSVWGKDTSGVDFCCLITDTDIRYVTLLGGPAGDLLTFQWQAYDLDTHTANTHVDGTMSGREGDDDLTGSRVASADYTDHLHGDEGSDTVDGDDDMVCGDAGDDTLAGGLGDAALHGDGGTNTRNCGGQAGDRTDAPGNMTCPGALLVTRPAGCPP